MVVVRQQKRKVGGWNLESRDSKWEKEKQVDESSKD